MQLRYITLTGADNTVDPIDLVKLALKYPYVEWAILFSKSRQGQSRYPSADWIDDLIRCSQDYPDMNFSAHLCGKWVEEALAGEVTFLQNENYKLRFRRIQFNLGKERLAAALKNKTFIGGVIACHKAAIFGGNYDDVTVSGNFFDYTDTFPLFDASGGRGIEAKDWPKPLTYMDYDPMDESKDKIRQLFCGYAGGLGPDNVVLELARIEEMVGEGTIWIDMETKIRSVKNDKDIFDLEKCEQVLQAAESWVA